MNERRNKNYAIIDWVKLVLAFIILTYHCRPWDDFQAENIGRLVSILTAFAVALFFMASGFFLFVKIEIPCTQNGENRLKRFMVRTLRLYLLWSLIYLPFAIYGEIEIYNESIPKAIIKILRGTLLLGRNYLSWHLWYLLALVVSAGILFWWLRKGVSEKKILLFSFLLFLAGRWLDIMKENGYPAGAVGMVAGIYFSLFDSTSNGVFTGLFYVSAGMYIAKHHILGKRRMAGRILVATMLGTASFFLYQYYIAVSLLIAVAAVMLFDMLIGTEVKDCRISCLARRASRDIYLIHMLFYGVYWIFFRTGVKQSLCAYIFTLSGTAVYVGIREVVRRIICRREKKVS